MGIEVKIQAADVEELRDYLAALIGGAPVVGSPLETEARTYGPAPVFLEVHHGRKPEAPELPTEIQATIDPAPAPEPTTEAVPAPAAGPAPGPAPEPAQEAKPEPSTEKKSRGRPRKAVEAAPVAPKDSDRPVDEPPPVNPEVKPLSGLEAQYEEARKALLALITAKGRDAAKELLAYFAAESVGKLDPVQVPDFIERAKNATA